MLLKCSITLFLCLLSSVLSAFTANVANMSLEEKVGQLFLVHFVGDEVNSDSERLISEAHVGGIIYFRWANGLSTPKKVFNLSQQLQRQALASSAAIPLFIAVDQEGGAITRLKTGFTIFPSQGALGQVNDGELIEACAYACGQELAAIGINMNFAPVTDILGDPNNPVIGIRAFSSSPDIVASLGERVINGYKRAGIVPVLKHFPGHGSVSQDSHDLLPIVSKPLVDFEAEDLIPFIRLHPLAEVMMTASVMIPELDPMRCATLSSLILKGLLRETMEYQGLVMSDSLCMGAILIQCQTVADAAVEAFCAGCDLLILGGIEGLGSPEQILTIHRHFVDKVREGVIDEKKVDLAVTKILALKAKTFNTLPVMSEIGVIRDFSLAMEHRDLAKRAAEGTIALSCSPAFYPREFRPLCDNKIAIIAPAHVREEIEMTRFAKIGNQTHFAYFNHQNPSFDEMQQAAAAADWADIAIVCAYNAWLNPRQLDFLMTFKGSGKPTVAMALREPYDVESLEWADITIKTYGPAPCSIDEALTMLEGKFLSDPQKLL